MKLLICALALLTSFSALANSRSMALSCSEYDRSTNERLSRSLILAPVSGEIGSKYELHIYEGLDLYPTMELEGSIETEDVHFDFISDDSSVGLYVYMDELNETTLYVNGEASGDFICRVVQ